MYLGKSQGRKNNIGYSSNGIKMWRVIMQHNPTTLISLYSYKTTYIMNVENMVDIQTPTELIHTKSPSEELWTAMFVKRQPDE